MVGFFTSSRSLAALAFVTAVAFAADAAAEPTSGAPTPKQSDPAPAYLAPAPEHVEKTKGFVFLVAGGAFATGSIVTGILADMEHAHAKSSCAPNCTDAELSTGRAFAFTSTILTCAAVVSTAVGAVLFFGGGRYAPVTESRAHFDVVVTPNAAAATTTVRF